jgi:hypothetical protein
MKLSLSNKQIFLVLRFISVSFNVELEPSQHWNFDLKDYVLEYLGVCVADNNFHQNLCKSKKNTKFSVRFISLKSKWLM